MSATTIQVPQAGRSYFANLSVQIMIGVIVAVGVAVALVIGLLGLHADHDRVRG